MVQYYCCPACGSEYFLSSKSSERTVFKLRAEREVEILETECNEPVDWQKICCGACGWQGDVDDLAEAR